MRRLAPVVLVLLVGCPALAATASAATIASSWPVGQAPLSLALDATTGKIYAANSETTLADGTGTVSVVDPGSGALVSLPTTLSSSFVLVDAASRRLYSSNSTIAADRASTDVFDLDTGARLASVPVGGVALALDAGLGRLYVGGRSLAAIDTRSNAIVGTLPASPAAGWFGVATDPDRHRLYLSTADAANPALFVFDDRDLSAVGRVPLGTVVRLAIAVDPVTHLVYVGGSDPAGGTYPGSSLYVIDPESLAVLHTTSLPGFPVGIALASGRHRIYVTDGYGQRVYGVDDATFEVAETITRLPFPPSAPVLHPDGRLYVASYNTRAGTNGTLVALDLSNHVPVFRSLAVAPASPTTNDLLVATAVAVDPDISPSIAGDPVTYTYEWSRNGSVIAGATGSTLDLSAPGNGDRGDTITVRVTASDGQLSAVASTSVAVADSAPVGSVSLSDVSPATNAVVSAVTSAGDPDNDPLIYRFRWKVNGEVRQTSSGPNASDSFALGPAGNGDRGDAIVVEVVASDGTLDSAAATVGATVVNSAPTLSVSLNTTTPNTKSVLVATVFGQDVDQDSLTYVYTWRLNGVVKRTVTTTATTDRYDLAVRGNGDKGDVVTITVTATDGSLASPAASLSALVGSH